MRQCAKCGTQNASERDFCTNCGEYLRWDPTGFMQAVPAPPPQAPPPAAPPPQGHPQQPPPQGYAAPPPPQNYIPQHPPAQPQVPQGPPPPQAQPVAAEPVVITLRAPGVEAMGPPTVEVEPGGTLQLVALIRNQSGIVDNYDLVLEGLPAAWWSISPTTVYLVPYGSGAPGFEQEVTIELKPPRAPEAEARPWQFQLVAKSRAQGGARVGAGPGTMVVRPFVEFQTDIRPQKGSGRRKATFTVTVKNKANAPVDVNLSATDPQDEYRFEFLQEKDRVSPVPGKNASTKFDVIPPKQRWIGAPQDVRFEVTPQAVGEQPSNPVRATFVHKAWLPRLDQDRHPDPAADGGRRLPGLEEPAGAAAGRGAGPAPDRPERGRRLQGPARGEARARRGQGGGVRGLPPRHRHQAGPGGRRQGQGEHEGQHHHRRRHDDQEGAERRRPELRGRQQGDQGARSRDRHRATRPIRSPTSSSRASSPGAARRPRRARPSTSSSRTCRRRARSRGGLQRGGRVERPRSSRATRRAARTRAAARTPAAATAAADTGGGGGDTGGGGDAAAVAAAAVGKSAAEAKEALAAAGLTPVENVVIAPDPPGTVLNAKEEGSNVNLTISGGYPLLAYDKDGDLFVASGADGKDEKPIAKSDDVEEQPAWNKNGTLIAYRRGPDIETGRIFLVDPNDPQSARPLTSEGFDDRRPAFSPERQGDRLRARHDAPRRTTTSASSASAPARASRAASRTRPRTSAGRTGRRTGSRSSSSRRPRRTPRRSRRRSTRRPPRRARRPPTGCATPS